MTGMLLLLAGAGMHGGASNAAFARLSPPAVDGVILGVGTCTTDKMRVVASGDGPFTYAWSIVEGDEGWTIADGDGVETSFSFPLQIHGDIRTAVVQVVVTGPGGTSTLSGQARARSTSTF